MKRIFLSIAAAFAIMSLNAQTKWTFDKAHSSVTFEITHMVITEVTGKFHTFDGQVMTENEDFTDAEIEFDIDLSSINTENERRDNHLRSADFFDVEKYPEITFRSRSFKRSAGDRYILTGDLTMHGVTQEIRLDVEFNGIAKDPWGNTKAGFRVTGSLDREDFGLTWNKTLESGDLFVGNEVKIICRVQLVRS